MPQAMGRGAMMLYLMVAGGVIVYFHIWEMEELKARLGRVQEGLAVQVAELIKKERNTRSALLEQHETFLGSKCPSRDLSEYSRFLVTTRGHQDTSWINSLGTLQPPPLPPLHSCVYEERQVEDGSMQC